jgi:DNA mismatch repair protein MutS2
LINQAKKRVESEKVRLDKTIARLQKERNKLQKNSNFLEKQKSESQKLKEQLLEKEQKVQEKLDSFVELYDNNQKMLSLGRKINELFNTYFQTNNKKKLITEFNAWVATEKVKFAKRNPKPVKSKLVKQKVTEQKKKEEAKIKATEKSVLKDVTKIRKEKKQKENIIAKEKANYVFKINDRVRLIDSNSVGTIESIEKNKVVINFGLFTTKTTTSKLELVEKAT